MADDTYKKTTETKVGDDGSYKSEEKVKDTRSGTERKTVTEDKPDKKTVKTEVEED